MSSQLVQVQITIPSAGKAPLPTGLTSGGQSIVVTDSTGAAQPAVIVTGAPYVVTTSLPLSTDGVTVSATVQATAIDSTGTPISAPGNPGPVISLTLTEPSFDVPGTTATMVLTPAAAAANPAVAAAVKGKK